MSLRTRLALALAAAAALPVLALGGISYMTTARELHRQLDASLTSYANRLADPDGRAIAALCSSGAPDDADAQRSDELLAGLPGAGVECISPDGEVIRWVAPSGLRAPAVPASLLTRHDVGVGDHTTVSVSGTTYRFVSYTSADGTVIRVGRSLAEVDHSLDVIGAWALGAGTVVIVVAALAGVLLARRITRPLETLTVTAEAVARTGSVDHSVSVERSDEIGRLANALDTMLAALHESRSQQQLLVQDASHELKTPLTSVRANIDLMRRHPEIPGEDRAAALDAAASELTELTVLMDELVTLAVEDAEPETASPVALDAVAEDAAQRARSRWHRDVQVRVVPVMVVAAPRLLARAVANLLDNAAKFSPDEAPIEVTVSADPPTLTVRDFGAGIDEEDLARVFDRFHRAVAARSMPGSGLGLAIVRRAADESGAQALAANHPSGGALLTLVWPADAAIERADDNQTR